MSNSTYESLPDLRVESVTTSFDRNYAQIPPLLIRFFTFLGMIVVTAIGVWIGKFVRESTYKHNRMVPWPLFIRSDFESPEGEQKIEEIESKDIETDSAYRDYNLAVVADDGKSDLLVKSNISSVSTKRKTQIIIDEERSNELDYENANRGVTVKNTRQESIEWVDKKERDIQQKHDYPSQKIDKSLNGEIVKKDIYMKNKACNDEGENLEKYEHENSTHEHYQQQEDIEKPLPRDFGGKIYKKRKEYDDIETPKIQLEGSINSRNEHMQKSPINSNAIGIRERKKDLSSEELTQIGADNVTSALDMIPTIRNTPDKKDKTNKLNVTIQEDGRDEDESTEVKKSALEVRQDTGSFQSKYAADKQNGSKLSPSLLHEPSKKINTFESRSKNKFKKSSERLPSLRKNVSSSNIASATASQVGERQVTFQDHVFVNLVNKYSDLPNTYSDGNSEYTDDGDSVSIRSSSTWSTGGNNSCGPRTPVWLEDNPAQNAYDQVM
eukprot:CAMPEP_0194266036 /NCGR_PEP_ID=MMETSP0169-20130528/1072_1 /TAXON_ID=218684 /ORGANISM="Corethron pennatum, Strain L29A3" /LENGTH=495 /DNA_ID=CAMNT_0039006619 /DNA_START=175 /DNA_END=1659 /DNA_ORIENTATION=+